MRYCNYRDVLSIYILNLRKLPGHFSYSLGMKLTGHRKLSQKLGVCFQAWVLFHNTTMYVPQSMSTVYVPQGMSTYSSIQSTCSSIQNTYSSVQSTYSSIQSTFSSTYSSIQTTFSSVQSSVETANNRIGIIRTQDFILGYKLGAKQWPMLDHCGSPGVSPNKLFTKPWSKV